MKVRRNRYFLEISGEQDSNKIREMIRLRVSTRVLTCHECAETIEKGQRYIRDKFWYNSYNSYLGQNVVVTKVNFICLKCWRGEVPLMESNNFKTLLPVSKNLSTTNV